MAPHTMLRFSRNLQMLSTMCRSETFFHLNRAMNVEHQDVIYASSKAMTFTAQICEKLRVMNSPTPRFTLRSYGKVENRENF